MSIFGGKKNLTNLLVLSKNLPFLKKFIYNQLRWSFDNFEGADVTTLNFKDFDDIHRFATQVVANEKYSAYFVDANGVILGIKPHGCKTNIIEPPTSGFSLEWQNRINYLVLLSALDRGELSC